MSQRIAVRSIVKKDGKVLLLRRASGREGLLGKYELPGGRVELGEQPEEAVARHLRDNAGVSVQTSHLSDVFTYTDPDSRDIQYGVILYTSLLAKESDDIKLGSKYDQYSWSRPELIQQEDLSELSGMLLNIHNSDTDDVGDTADLDDVEYTSPERGSVVIYSDGGSRGNPGPSAAGYVILDADDRLLFEGGAYLGITTNNQAEYHGVHLGLEKARELGAKRIEFRLDSLLVVNQLNGLYVIRNRELWPIHERIRALVREFDKVTFRHIKREFNQQADSMVNKVLDAHAKKKV